jgi:hypothetical protein
VIKNKEDCGVIDFIILMQKKKRNPRKKADLKM